MQASTRNRIAATFSAAAMLVGCAVTLGAGSAVAAPSAEFSAHPMQSDGSRSIYVKRNGKVVGAGKWIANGDILRAEDQESDGYYITAVLSTGRDVNTKGKPAPSKADDAGNLPEDKTYTMFVCIGNDSTGLHCSGNYSVRS
ncbi:hypothetical protein SNS2_0022 [Streptomyces netropsis]|uniref:Secreted protein n=1 Tax=Streptomyces syringium TaxID=76729 RepID=A0ABS4XYB4_9ACTN|nr:hypothetical protein [Streptomyces syringium]MBP2401494.1 hypothetical protein [Streptomyces syringium]SPE47617.1 hypothetical protein SNS2_0022 [Streptomyces netropsis]